MRNYRYAINEKVAVMLKKLCFIILFAIVALYSYGSFAEDEKVIELPIRDTSEIITKSGVEIDNDIWAEGNESLLVNTQVPIVVELFELDQEDFGESRLTYKAQMRSEDLVATGDARGISYLEMIATFPDGEELVSRGPRVPISGTTDWRTANTVLYIDRADSPKSVKLNLVVEGQGKAWLDDVRLELIPLRVDYLFWGHIVVWIVLIIYIYGLLRKNRELKKELETIK